MPAMLKLSNALRDYVGGKVDLPVESGRSVRDTLTDLNIKPELIALVTVNGEHQSKDYVIQDGDIVKALAVIGGG